MKNFLQMLYEFIPKKGIGFEKYLVVFCMLIGVQASTFAQPGGDPGIPAGSSTARLCDPGVTSLMVDGAEKLNLNPQDYVYRVTGSSVTLSVSSFLMQPVSVKWEKKTTKDGNWIFVETKPSDEPLEVTNLESDVLYRATFDNGMLGGSDQRALLVTGKLTSDMASVCPGKAIEFDIVGGEFAYRSEWWFGLGDNELAKEKEYADGTTTYSKMSSDVPTKSYVVLKYDEFNCSKSAQSPRFQTSTLAVGVETDCKEDCKTTSTGDYYEGTDFDPSQLNSGKIPEGVQHHFADRDITFNEGDIKNYWIGTNAQEFFGQIPYLDQNIAPNSNYYMFCENPNDRIVSLGFPAYKYKNNSYTYKMRLYLQVGQNCDQPISQKWDQAKFIVRTEQGTVTRDCLEIIAYDNEGNPLRGTKNPVVNGKVEPVVIEGTDTRIRFPEFMDITALKTYDIIRIEIQFYGMFPDKNDPPVFIFKPMFEQFGCAKVAVDYISAQVEDVCLKPQVVCIDSIAVANAAGYPRNSKYTWLKETYRGSGQYAVFDPSLNGVGSDYEQAQIVVKEIGKYNYRLVVEATVDGKPYRREKDFVIAGINCKVTIPTGIEGSGVFCLPNELGYKPNIIDDDPEVRYEWNLYDPDGNLLYEKEHAPQFIPNSARGDSLTIKLDETAREGEYKLEVHTFRGSIEQEGSPVFLPLSVYRKPQASLILGGPKYDGISEQDKQVCPSDVRSEKYTVALNGFETPAKSLYTYSWSSDPNGVGVFTPRTHQDTADINVAAIPGLCSGDVDSVEFSVVVDVRGCSDTAKNSYGVQALGELQINCESLSGRDTFYCESKKETAVIAPFPIPEFDSSCDLDPDIIIEITPRRKEVKDTMGTKTIVVRKSEIDNKTDKLKISLPWGLYDFHYTLQDGCGRTKSCDHPIVVEKGYPDIPCEEILDLDVINGRDSIESSKCAVKLGVKDIPIPELLDRNSENDTILVGVYAGRRHFTDRQDKNELKVSSSIAKFDLSIGLYDEYEIDYTYILWKFTNGDKSSYCVQEVVVRDTGVPSFDCATIDPFEYRPETETCEIEFKDFKNYLYGKKYTAYDSCPEPVTPIPGELHEDSVKISKVDESKVFLVGIADTLYWQFRDRHDNLKYCPQVVNPKSKRPVVIDCKTLEYFEGTAKDSTCFVDAEDLNIPNPPYGKEACVGKNGDSIAVPGVGTRSDGKALDDPYPVGDTYITWLFEGINSAPATCTSHVFVRGVKPPVLDCDFLFPKKWYEMPDCDSMDITLETKKVPDPCVAGFMSEGVPYINGEKIELTHKFPIGETFVTWKFWDYTKSAVDSCIQSIHLRDTFPPVVNCDTMKNDSVLLHDKCSIPTKDLRDSLEKKIAIEYCTGDTIWGEPYLINDKGERVEFPSEVSVGIYPIQWVFANDSLTTKESVCDKTLYLLHDGEPIFDCSSLPSPLQLWDTTGECKINTLPIPEAVDSCKRDYIVYGHGYVQLFEKGDYVELCYFDREKNKVVYLMDIPLGGHKIKWVFKSPFSIKEKICYQNIKVNSDAINKVDCSKLAEYVHVTMRRQGPGATFEEVRDSGLILPNIDFDICKVLDTIYTRDDKKSIYDIYPVNSIVTITWLFRDTTENAVKEKVCHTVVEVQDGDTPICKSPLFDSIYTCLDALPAKYADYSEFRKAGGKLISNGVDVSDFVDPSTFKLDTMSLGDKCDFTFRRTYTVKNLRNQTVRCIQNFHVKDIVPPVWLDDATSLTKVFDCVAEDFFPTDLKAKDECSSEIISEYHKVSSLDGVVDGLFYTVSSNRSQNPEDCEYYNYTETRKYVAVDRCRNYSDILKFEAQVQDTFNPVINMPDTASWRKSFVPAVYAHEGCTFLYPDLTSLFPKDSLKDICDPAAAKFFKIYQTPAAGTVIQNTKIPQFVTLHVADPCGLEDTLMKEIYVQDTKDIIDVEMKDTTICAELKLTLNDLFKYSGYIYRESWFEENVWVRTDNYNVVYDYYKGEVDVNNLIYSNNKETYAHRFNQTASPREFIELSALSDEGFYTIVGMDTSLHCVDTTSAYITVHSAPTIGLDAEPLLVCEKDSIHLISDNETLYEKYNLIVHDNGEEITEEGWMLNGEKYKPETLLDYTDALIRMHYYATNKCETGKSNDWISLSMRRRMSPDNLMLTTEPNNPARVYLGESAKLNLVSKYKPESYMWYRVKGIVDGNSDKMFDKYGNVREDYMDSDFEQDSLLGITNYGDPGSRVWDLTELGDSAKYYVLLVDSVCPAVPSNIVSIDVVQKLPTAFTPHNSIGMNDVFMEGHKVVIFNRYGQKMVESDNGWDGTCRGDLVDPGVYFYEVIINDGEKHKGSIEVVYFK